MITSKIQSQQSEATVDPLQYDPTEANMSIGWVAMRRSKRDGRNPSTGARTSKPYGLSMVFETGIPALYNSLSEPIY